MDHSHDRANKPDLLGELSIGVHGIIADVRRAISFRFISKAQHLPSLGIKLGVSCEGNTGQLAIKVVISLGLQGLGVQSIGAGILLQGKKLAVEGDNIGVCGSSDLEFDGVCVLISVLAQQCSLSLSLLGEFFSTDVSLLEVNASPLDAECADVAIAIEPLKEIPC